MSKLTFIFSKNSHIGGWCIRTIYGDRFDHVGLYFDRQQSLALFNLSYPIVVDATVKKGVAIRPFDPREYAHYDFVGVDHVNQHKLEVVSDFITGCLGCSYDYKGVLSFLNWLRFLKENKEAWYCTELCATIFYIVNAVSPIKHKYRPQEFYNVLQSGLNHG